MVLQEVQEIYYQLRHSSSLLMIWLMYFNIISVFDLTFDYTFKVCLVEIFHLKYRIKSFPINYSDRIPLIILKAIALS